MLNGILVDCQGKFCSSFSHIDALEPKINLKIDMLRHVK